MIKKTNTRLIVAAVSLAVASSLVASPAMAKKRHKHHKRHHSSRSYSSSSSSYSSGSSEVNSKVDALEAQVRAMQDEMSSLRANAAGGGSADAAKVQELDAWMQDAKSKPAAGKDNMVFFRGGYAHNNSDRGGTLDPTSLGAASNNSGLVVGAIGDRDAWYFGAGFDFSLSDDLFGLANGTEVLAELMFDYKNIGEKQSNGLSPQETATLGALGINLPAANTESATVNQLSLAASPKIKFMKGSAFRPWLIPVGFELSIISPPSDAITVLTPGMMFGFGADYRVWNNIYVGADARYHYTPGNIDGVNTDGVTAGGYLGIGF